MRYRVTHRTTYAYDSPVTVSHYLARLAPRALPSQACPWHEMHIIPEPCERAARTDYFGNDTVYFEIEGAHEQLEVLTRSLVEVYPIPPPDPAASPSWESVQIACRGDTLNPATRAGEFVFASPLIAPARMFAEYAKPSFPAMRPVLECVCDLNGRIHRDFTFDPTATSVATPLERVFAKRRGVCQDFAQVMIACLRSMGLPARYVSGYLETLPPPGQAKLVGADASHAWVSVWCGEELGWTDADPTNDLLPSVRHLTVAWGRDFNDVSPLRGVRLGTGEPTLRVGVDVVAESGD